MILTGLGSTGPNLGLNMLVTFIILGVTLVLFIVGRFRSDLVALMALLALFLTGVLTLDQSLAGFSNSTVILIAALFVVGEGLSRTGVTAWLGDQLLRLARGNPTRLLVVMMLGAAALSAFVSNTGTVATLLPAVVSAAWRVGGVPSQFLMGLAYSTNTGGLLTLTGTPPNIVVADTLAAEGLAPFGFFEFSLIGLPLLAITVVYMMTIGRRLLPERDSDQRPIELSQSVRDVADTFGLEEAMYALRVRAQSPLAGQTLEQAALGRDHNVTVLRVQRNQLQADEEPDLSEPLLRRLRSQVRDQLSVLQPPDADAVPGPSTLIRSQDRLIVKGRPEDVTRLAVANSLGLQQLGDDSAALKEALLSSEVGIAEVLLAVRSQYIGRTVTEVRIADKYRVQVLGIWRGDRRVTDPDTRLRFGDALLVRGRWADIELLQQEGRNFVVVGSPESLSKQVVELTPRSLFAVVALAAMVVMMVTGIVPVVMAALITAVLMVLAGCLTMTQAYRAINWQSVILVAAMLPLSTALEITGGASLIANGLVNTLGTIGPVALLAGVFLLTTGFSQIISNTATAVLIAPIVFKAAVTLGISPYPLLMGVAVAASNAFMTPIGTTTNLMVQTPGGYRFNDYLKGAPPHVDLPGRCVVAGAVDLAVLEAEYCESLSWVQIRNWRFGLGLMSICEMQPHLCMMRRLVRSWPSPYRTLYDARQCYVKHSTCVTRQLLWMVTSLSVWPVSILMKDH
ncbi:MAG: SLC13 family permease [Chloroflexota bacterium]